MAKNTNNIRIGVCDIYFDKQDGQGEIDLGHTKGGVEFNFERDLYDIVVDKYGSSAVDKVANGGNIMIKCYLAEPTNKNLGIAIPEGVYSEGVASDSKVGLGRDSGFSLKSVAGILRLHPIKNGPSNRNEDIYIWKAVSVETVPMNFKIDDQRILEVTFVGLVDESQPNGQYLGRVGDEAIS